VKKIFIDNDIFCVVHFAALKSVSESYENPLLYYDVNVNGTLNILKVMNEMNCKKIIFSSSACIYGNIKKNLIKENDDLQPINVYGTTKLIGENILKDLVLSDKTWKVFILRYFNVVGAHPSGLIGDNPKKKK
jgi:UDP-glucose 4-epimerase